jgi:DNA adenine methylase
MQIVKNNIVKSPLNYIGGKYKLLPQILPLFPNKINIFVDLFAGGCNVGMNVNANKIICNDNLCFLIDLYKDLQNNSIDYSLEYIENKIIKYKLSLTNEQGYKQLREEYNKNHNSLDLFVLIAYSFNHQIRFNNSHQFNNPFGRERSCFNSVMKNNLIKFITSLKTKDISFCCNNFDDFNFSSLTENDFVYLDPPYLITTGTYNDGKRGFTGWSEKEENKLIQILNELNKKHIPFALSNVLTHKNKENHILKQCVDNNDYYVNHLTMDYSNSNYHILNRDRYSSQEVLITNYIIENKNKKKQLNLFESQIESTYTYAH